MEKKEKRQRKIQRQQEILNGAKAAHRELSEAEQREFDTLQGRRSKRWGVKSKKKSAGRQEMKDSREILMMEVVRF